MNTFRFLYAFHNKDFRHAFQKTLSKYFICCRQRRKSTGSAGIPLPPATPSGEQRNLSSSKGKGNKKRQKEVPETNLNEEISKDINKLIQQKDEIQTPNGNLTCDQNSMSSK